MERPPRERRGISLGRLVTSYIPARDRRDRTDRGDHADQQQEGQQQHRDHRDARLRGRGRDQPGNRQNSQGRRERVRLLGLDTLDKEFTALVLRHKKVNLDAFTRSDDGSGFVFNMPYREAKILDGYTAKFSGQKFTFQIDLRATTLNEAQVQLLKNVILGLYNPERKSWHLQGIIDNEQIKAAGIKSSVLFSNFTWGIAAKEIPQVETIDFSNNRLSSLSGFKFLPEKTPHLQNLSFANNAISKLEDLDHLSRAKNLKELIVTQNPIMDEFDQQIQEKVKKMFPNLVTFNGAQVKAFIVRPVDTEDDFPPCRPSFIDPNTLGVVEQLLKHFFSCLDSQREKLELFYHDNATFSFYDVEQPNRPKNRNLHHHKDLDQAVNFTSVGKTEIASTLRGFPVTKHESQFVVDAWEESDPVSCLLVFVHGFYSEVNSKYEREFDRTFVLKPSREHSSAREQGLLFEIQSDQLRTRRSTSASVIKALTREASVTSTQEERILQIVNQTNLRPERARELLEHSNWSCEEALKKLQDVSNIPADYFRS